MIVYRIAKQRYLSDMTGTGARLYGGRWNKVGLPLLYTSSHLSLAVLELLANHVRNLIDHTYGYVTIEVPDNQIKKIDLNTLHRDWRLSPYHDSTTQLGSRWIQHQESLALLAPSAALHQEHNLLINPLHPDNASIKIIDYGPLELDGRIIQ